jgi:hypothetical protein
MHPRRGDRSLFLEESSMKRKTMKQTVALLSVLSGLFAAGCATTRQAASGPVAPPAAVASASAVKTTGEHKTAHQGSLNPIERCEIGHAEVKLEGKTLSLWFVGSPDTTRAVPIPERAVVLKVQIPGEKNARTLRLRPQPLDLAGETVGNCSHFEGEAPWLSGLGKFTATGTVVFKGTKRPLRIEYPGGYDPD